MKTGGIWGVCIIPIETKARKEKIKEERRKEVKEENKERRKKKEGYQRNKYKETNTCIVKKFRRMERRK